MDWKQFIASMVGSLAWPVVVALVFLAFKGELIKIIQRVARLKYKDLELDFDKVKQHAKALNLKSEQEAPILTSPVFTSLEDQILDAVEKAPSAAILLAWSALETAVASAVSRLGLSAGISSHRPPLQNIEALVRGQVLSRNHEHLLREMRSLRNKIAHGDEVLHSISQTRALDYATAALDLIKYLEDYPRSKRL